MQKPSSESSGSRKLNKLTVLQTSTSTIAFTEMDVEFHNCQGVLSSFLRYLTEIDRGGLGRKHKRVKVF